MGAQGHSGPRYEPPAEHEVGGQGQAGRGVKKIEGQFPLHEAHREDHEHNHGDDLLGHFELAETHVLDAEAIGWDLKAVFNKGHAPTRQDGDPERASRERLQMTVPGIGHEHVG